MFLKLHLHSDGLPTTPSHQIDRLTVALATHDRVHILIAAHRPAVELGDHVTHAQASQSTGGIGRYTTDVSAFGQLDALSSKLDELSAEPEPTQDK